MPRKKRVVQTLRIIMPIIGIICAIVLAPWDGIWAWITPLPNTVQEQVNNAIGHGLDGIIVYVDEAGKAPAFYTAGWKNQENKIPADPESLFKIASINKLYVAVAVTKLVNEQRLSLDDTLASHLPEYIERIENAQRITLRLMLQHRSGIPNWADHPEYPWGDPPQSANEVLEYALDLPADFEPDESYGYSNTNYFLLAEIMDKVLGYSHFQYIKDEILLPLNLENTFRSLLEVNLDDVASGYFVGYESDLKDRYYGSMIATAEDVGIFIRALNDGSLLSDKEQAIYSSVYDYGHSGLLPGYYSIAKYYSKSDTVVVQFVNTTGGTPIAPLVDVGGGTKVLVSNVVFNRIVRILSRQ